MGDRAASWLLSRRGCLLELAELRRAGLEDFNSANRSECVRIGTYNDLGAYVGAQIS